MTARTARYVTHDGRSLSVCTECGCVVQYARTAAHSVYHDRLRTLEGKVLDEQSELPGF